MNTERTNFKNEQEMIKDLFQKLFQIQILLERFTNRRLYFYDDIDLLIQMIDELMHCLLNLYDS